MKLITNFGITAVTLLLTACATDPYNASMERNASMKRKVSIEEAFATENTGIAQSTLPEPEEKLYTQPANKTEHCKVLTSKDQLERKNFRAYWDGDCKNGYAYGLGRDIALSNTHHQEEITIYKDSGNLSGQPTRSIDYVQKRGHYGTWISENSEGFSGHVEEIENNSTNFFITYKVGVSNGEFSRYITSSPFRPDTLKINQTHGKPGYVIHDYSELPSISSQPKAALYTADPITGNPKGYRLVNYFNGTVEHQKLSADGQSIAEQVQLPQEYLDHLQEKSNEIQVAVQKANVDGKRNSNLTF